MAVTRLRPYPGNARVHSKKQSTQESRRRVSLPHIQRQRPTTVIRPLRVLGSLSKPLTAVHLKNLYFLEGGKPLGTRSRSSTAANA
jgi:hypothetical protein